jgi:hypothetical protein
MVSDIARKLIRAAAGLNDPVSTSDHIEIQMTRASKVFCVACRKHIYYLKEQKDGSRSFAPTEIQQIMRQDLICPLCGNNLAARWEGQPMLKTDRGWV